MGIFDRIKDVFTPDDAKPAEAAPSEDESVQTPVPAAEPTVDVSAGRAPDVAPVSAPSFEAEAPAAEETAAEETAAKREASKPAHESRGAGLEVDGKFGPKTIAATQRWVGAKVDGVWGPQSKRALQKKLGVTVDGEVGPKTIKALQAKVGAKVDGEWGPDTVRHLQQFLNEH